MRGKLVTFEGIDGTGKSTLVKLVREDFESRGVSATFIRFPGETPLGRELRRLLFKEGIDTHPLEENYRLGEGPLTCLFLADFLQTLEEVIEPALEQGKIAICDRYSDSQMAYQAQRNIPRPLKTVYSDMAGPEPDITFLLLIDPKLGFERANQNRTGGKTLAAQQGRRWNNVAHQRAIQDAYMENLLSRSRTKQIWLQEDMRPGAVYRDYIRPVLENELYDFLHVPLQTR